MSTTVVTDTIEVRSLMEGDKPRYVVRGTAQVANKPQIYKYFKNKDGSIKTLSNIFTPHCIESIRKQSRHKKLFIDTQHELARNASVKAIIKDKLNPEDQKRIESMLKKKMLPLAKINDINITGDSLDIDTELNPMFREVDTDHKNYFDAVWYSLEKRFLNSISINFGKYTYDTDKDGNTVIDDVDVLGFSYEDGAAGGPDHSIYEVAMRALEEGEQTEGELKMKEEKEKLEADQKKLDEDKKTLETEKAEIQKVKDEKEAADKEAKEKETKEAEEKKKTELETQAEEQKKVQDDLDKRSVEIKAKEDEMNRAKGIVLDKANPNAPAGAGDDGKLYKEGLAEITKDHDESIKISKSGVKPLIDKTMKGFSELANLQAKAGSHTADLDEKNADYIRESRLLDKADSDSVTPKLAQQ